MHQLLVMNFEEYYCYYFLEKASDATEVKLFINLGEGDYTYTYPDALYLEEHPECLEDEFPGLLKSDRDVILSDIEKFITTVEQEIEDEEGLFNCAKGSDLSSNKVSVKDNRGSTKKSYTKRKPKNKAVR